MDQHENDRQTRQNQALAGTYTYKVGERQQIAAGVGADGETVWIEHPEMIAYLDERKAARERAMRQIEKNPKLSRLTPKQKQRLAAEMAEPPAGIDPRPLIIGKGVRTAYREDGTKTIGIAQRV